MTPPGPEGQGASRGAVPVEVPVLDPTEWSPAQRLVADILRHPTPREALQALLDQLSVTELAGLFHDWWNFWVRPKQVIPIGPWLSWGFLAGRAFGKTRAISEFVVQEVMAGRATRIGLIAQSLEKCWEVQIEGKSGLLAVSPPWFK